MCGPCVSNVARLPMCILALAVVVPALLGSIPLAAPEVLPLRASTPSPFLSSQALDPWVVHTAGHFQIPPPSGWIVRGNLTLSGGVVDVLPRGTPDPGQSPVGGGVAVTHAARA